MLVMDIEKAYVRVPRGYYMDFGEEKHKTIYMPRDFLFFPIREGDLLKLCNCQVYQSICRVNKIFYAIYGHRDNI